MSRRILLCGFVMLLWSMVTCGDLRLCSSPAWAQADPAKVLIGTWVGHAEVPRDSERVLIIRSVTPKDGGGWVADGGFGGKGDQRIEIKVSASRVRDIILEFVTGQNNPVRLKLVGENRLDGTLNIVLQNRTSNRSLKLEKKEGPK